MSYIKYAVILLSLSAEAGVPEQNVVNSSGGNLKNNKYLVDFSVGEVAINSIGTHTLGFLQPAKLMGPLAIENQAENEEMIKVFPNPVKDKIYWNTADHAVKKVFIFAASGIKVLETEASKAEINMENLIQGLYYVQFLDLEDKPVSVFKIIKN